MGQASQLKVLLADDQTPARAGIKRAIEPHGLQVVAEAANAEDALRLAEECRPDVCVLAVGLPGHGIEAARRIKESLPQTKIVMMTVTESEEDLLTALRAGADGYLLMSTPADRLPHAILGMVQGEAALPRKLTARLITEFRERGTRRRLTLPSTGGEVELTAREFEVLERLRKGDRTGEIAARLGISEVTVRRHVASVLRKLRTPNRRSAVDLLEESERAELCRASSE
jgi:DNA-binding NarL/FixJ family response regulator